MKYATIFALAAAAVVSARPTDDMSEAEHVDLEAPVTAVPDPIPEATALSGPRPSENIDIHDVWIRKNITEAGEKVITAVYFELDGDDAQNVPCHVSNPRFPDPKGADIGNCKDTKYSFTLHAGTDNTTDYSLRIYHETGLASGKWGQGNLPTVCRAAGNGPYDYMCNMVPFDEKRRIVIDNTPPPVEV